jgi:hypothetical protein
MSDQLPEGGGLYVNPAFKELLRESMPLPCRLDDLVQGGERAILQNILRWVLLRLPQGFSAETIEAEWIDKGESDAVIAHHCALFLEYDNGFEHTSLEAINKLIAECTPEA